MNSNPEDLEPRYWTPLRQDLLAWLQQEAPSLAELYEGAVELLYGDVSIPGRSRFIAHAVREFPDSLLKHLLNKKLSQFQPKNRLDDLARLWEDHGLPGDDSLPSTMDSSEPVMSGKVAIPERIYVETARLVRDHRAARSTPWDRTEVLFNHLAPELEKDNHRVSPAMKKWIQIRKWFVQRAHDKDVIDEELMDEIFVRNFEQFETILSSLTREYYRTKDEIDGILEDANS